MIKNRITFYYACLVFLCVPLGFAKAGTMEAREFARSHNCTPKKIDVVRQTLGIDGKTIYRVDCTLPKAKEDGGATTPQADVLMVECTGSLCVLLRRAVSDAK